MKCLFGFFLILIGCSETPPTRYFYAIDVGASETTVSKMIFKGSSAYGLVEATYPNGTSTVTVRQKVCGYFSGPMKSIAVEIDDSIFWVNTTKAFNFKPTSNSPTLNYQEDHAQKDQINSVLEPVEPNCT